MKNNKRVNNASVISSLLNRNPGDSTDLIDPMLLLSTLFFIVGMTVDLVFYISSSKTTMCIVNAVSIVLMPIYPYLSRLGKITADKAMTIHVITVAVNLYITILFYAAQPDSESIISLMFAVCIFIIPAMLSGMTSFRWLSITLTGGLVACYTVAGIKLGSTVMLQNIPIVALVMVGTSIAHLRLIEVARRAEYGKKKATHDQHALIRFFNVKPAQWELIRNGKLSKGEAADMLNEMNSNARNKLIDRLKDHVQSDEEIKRPLRERFPNLTAGDMWLCCHIIRGMTVSEISTLREVKISSITAQRSRLRTKLGLTKQQSLREFLESVVRNNSLPKTKG